MRANMLRGAINTGYHMPHRPFFDSIEIKGGGDAASAARAVLQTGEFDYAWNTLVEDEILRRLEAGGKGRVAITPAGTCEHVQLNTTDPWTEVDGERSSVKTVHPVFSDKAAREALKRLVDGVSDALEVIRGRIGKPLLASGRFEIQDVSSQRVAPSIHAPGMSNVGAMPNPLMTVPKTMPTLDEKTVVTLRQLHQRFVAMHIKKEVAPCLVNLVAHGEHLRATLE